ncbi:MAG: hypothetical protein FJX62_03000 [Alphaproteobacteria bacterium]|nr:hypothetical protein [Alphaproteobacteria bacterium]
MDAATKSPVAGADTGAGTKTMLVFADSAEALEQARGLGLPGRFELRTWSPGLLRDRRFDALRADAALTPTAIAELNAAAVAMGEDLYRHFADPANGGDHHLGIAAGRSAYAKLHILLLKAAALTDADYDRPVTLIDFSGGDSVFEATYAPVLAELLAGHPEFRIVRVPVQDIAAAPDPRPPSAGLRARLAFSGATSLAYRALDWFGRKSRLSGPRGSVLVLRENELVKETAVALALSGYAVHSLKDPRAADTEARPDDVAAVSGVVERIVDGGLAGRVESRPRRALAQAFSRIVATQIAKYRASLSAWRERLDELQVLRPKAVLSNIVAAPEAVGLHKVLQERKIPLVGFQHGVTVEINAAAVDYRLTYENSATDFAIMFNEEGARLSRANPFRSGGAMAAGLPQDYRRTGRRRARQDAAPIWYVATALYLGNRGLLFEGVSDADKADYEIAMIDRVLARLPHRVFYKPYPAFRYIDPDPIIETARAAPNVSLYEERADLRYVMSAARVIVTSRSFSTPSWCIMSGRPMVYIDIPQQTPLRPEARAAFERAVFVFDAGAPGFHRNLKDFLSQPVEDIERLYAEKVRDRAAFVERFVSTGGPGAGRRAARAVRSLIASGTRHPAAAQ